MSGGGIAAVEVMDGADDYVPRLTWMLTGIAFILLKAAVPHEYMAVVNSEQGLLCTLLFPCHRDQTEPTDMSHDGADGVGEAGPQGHRSEDVECHCRSTARCPSILRSVYRLQPPPKCPILNL